MYGDITDVDGIKVGQAENPEALTGCTVILAEGGAVGGVDVRGGAPGTRETDLLRPGNLVERVHAVVLSGGSAFGLDAACGVMRYLEEAGVGFDVGMCKVPIVCSAVIFDLGAGESRKRPDAAMGYKAARAARVGPLRQGNAGAGMGATVGKLFGIKWAMKGGVGSCSTTTSSGVKVGALVVVNSFGDVLDPREGRIIAGSRDPSTGRPADTGAWMLWSPVAATGPQGFAGTVEATLNTTVAVVATDARLTKEQANRVAAMAHDGLARCISPVHTLYDGDTIFSLSLGDKTCDVNVVGVAAAWCVAAAALNAIRSARSVGGIPAAGDL